MSQLAVINYPQLEEFLQTDGPSDEEVKNWYDRLADYEIEGSESPPEIELLFNAAKYLMGFGFTAAEELRDVAEQEAVTMAEKEDQWEEQKAVLNQEIDSLRDRITSKADVGDSTEAFRAQIDSLKEENRQLQQSNRDRDREMADQRDRFENLASRVDTLTRERDALSDHKAQLEDTIRELNRRLSAKTEDTAADWESKKLKLRNEQVITISRQMQAAETQNQELKEYNSIVANALEEANRMIEQTALKLTDMTSQLELKDLRIEELYNQNRRLTQILPEELVEHIPRCISAAENMLSGRPVDKVNFLIEVADLLTPKFLNENDLKALEDATGLTEAEEQKERIERGEERIRGLQEELAAVVEESNKMRLLIREDRTGEKEQELEQLKKELVDATTLARNLFGEAMSDVPGQDPTTTLQMRILQLEHSLEQLNEEKEKQKKTMKEMQFTIEQKDWNNQEILIQLNQLKDTRFGSAREHISEMEKQLKFREEQIGKLQQHCTLLQIELGRYAEGSYEPAVKPKTPRVIKRPDKLLISKKQKDESETPREEVESPAKPSPRAIEDEPPTRRAPHPTAPVHQTPPNPPTDYSDVAQQAILISNLYYEMMQLLEEITYKDEKLVEMQKSWKSTQKSYQEMSAQLELAYGEIRRLKKENSTIEERTLNEMKETESMELQRLVESINMDGTELERRMGEASRKLVTERIERIRHSRQCTILKTKVERLEAGLRRVREMTKEREVADQRTITRLKYEVDAATIEIGRLQTRVLQSIPTDEYDKLMRKYKRIIKEGSGVETNNEEMPRQQLTAFSRSPAEAEVEARENMLKKMIDVVSDQGEFWSHEAATLQAENEELKKLLEDIERTSDLKTILGAIERRLLDTIRELRENEREYLREKKRQRGADGEAARDSERLRQERVALLNVINVLQRENKTLRDQAMGTVSLQQLELFRANIFEARKKETEIASKLENVDRIKEETETEMLRVRALKTANEVLSQFDGHEMQPPSNNEVTERQMQMAFFNASQQSAKAKQLERMVHLKEQRVAELNDEMRELRQWNLELITTLEAVKEFRGPQGRRESLRKQESRVVEPMGETKEVSPDGESEYDEMEVRSEDSSSEASSDRVVVRTIVQDNVEAFENRIKEIKTSAQLAVQGYKEQLELKELALERYKTLLREKIDEGVHVVEKVEIVHREVEVPDREAEEKLKETERKVRELEAEIRRIRRRQTQKKQHEESGDELERRGEDDSAREYLEVEVQTDWEASLPPPPTSSNNANEDVEEAPKSAKSERMKRLEEEMQILQEVVAKSDSKDGENMRQKSEIRDLKARIQRLTKTNKDLMATCEQIKEDALAELSTFRRNNENSDERRMTDLRIELDRLRSTNRTIRGANEELKTEVSRLKQLTERKSAKNEPDEWERRKRQDEVIASLREKLKRKETLEKEFQEKLDKRERVIETMRNDQALRSSEIERLQKRLKSNDAAVVRERTSKEWQLKVDVLESSVTKKSEELAVATRNLQRIRTEIETVKTRHTRELERIRLETSEMLAKETKRAREETKREMTVIRPAMQSRDTQTELSERKKSSSSAGGRSRAASVVALSSSSSSSSSSVSSPIYMSPKTSSRLMEQRRLSRKSVATSVSLEEHFEAAPKSDRSDYYQLKESLQSTQDRLMESQEQLLKMERDYSSLYEKFESLKIRTEKEEKPTGAVLVLSDKLAAKDREIAQLKSRIAHLQRTVHLPV